MKELARNQKESCEKKEIGRFSSIDVYKMEPVLEEEDEEDICSNQNTKFIYLYGFAVFA
jgi:hypothetical protein